MTPEQKEKFHRALKDSNLVFYFVPSVELKKRVFENSDPILCDLAKSFKIAIMMCENGKGIGLDTQLVLKFVDGSIDSNNEYWMNMGDIRVSGVEDMVLKSNSSKTNN